MLKRIAGKEELVRKGIGGKRGIGRKGRIDLIWRIAKERKAEESRYLLPGMPRGSFITKGRKGELVGG